MNLDTQIIVRMSSDQKKKLFEFVRNDISEFVRVAIEEKLKRVDQEQFRNHLMIALDKSMNQQ